MPQIDVVFDVDFAVGIQFDIEFAITIHFGSLAYLIKLLANFSRQYCAVQHKSQISRKGALMVQLPGVADDIRTRTGRFGLIVELLLESEPNRQA